MDKTAQKELRSRALHGTLLAYANRLQRIFTNMGSFSDAVPLSRETFHAPLHLQQCDPKREQQSYWPGSSGHPADRDASRQLVPAVDESKFLLQWLSRSPQPLVILAPFGSGKSVVLESFALAMALKLQADPPGSIPLFVPLPVRLRAWRWYGSEDSFEPFRDFLHRSQKVLAPDDEDGLLTSEQIRLLMQNKLLVPLLDGLDELPDRYTGGRTRDPRRTAVQSIKSLFVGSHFAIASRPGFGAEHEFQPDYIHTLRELTQTEIDRFVGARFGTQPAAKKTKALKAYHTLQPALAQILRRPLFLTSWCARAQDVPEAPPGTLHALMDELLLRTFDPIRLAEPTLTKETLYDARAAFAEVLLHFVDSDHAHIYSYNDLRQAMPAHVLDSRPAATTDAIRWLEKAGLLEPVGIDGYRASKTPLLEYLIGSHLVTLAMSDTRAQRRVLELFRKWVWRPHLHDTLDFMFDALWKKGEQGRAFASSLLQWLMAAAQGDVVYHSAGPEVPDGQPYPQDDLVRPLAISAVRWYARDTRYSDAARDAARALTPSLAYAASHGVMLYHLALLPILFSNALLTDVVAAMIANYPGLSMSLEATDDLKWLELIKAVARRVPESSAEQCVHEWLSIRIKDEDTVPGEDAWRQAEAWCMAIGAAASCVPEVDAARLVRQWIAAYESSRPAIGRSLLSLVGLPRAIEGAATRVHEDNAADLVEELIATFSNRKNGFPAGVHEAIYAAARCVCEDDAPRVVQGWVMRYKDAEDGSTEQSGWSAGVSGAASRVNEGVAAAMVRLALSQQAKHNVRPQEKLAWRKVCVAAAERVDGFQAPLIVAELIAVGCKRNIDDGAWSDLLFAVGSAAGRVDQHRVADVLEEWATKCNKGARESRARKAWEDAIWNAAGEVAEADAVKLVSKLFCAASRCRSEDDGMWLSAIVEVAGRVCEDDAFQLMQTVLYPRYLGETNVRRKSLLRRALGRAAHRLRTEDAMEASRLLIAEYGTSGDDRVAREELLLGVEGAARCADDDDVVALCGILMGMGVPRVAFKVAAAGTAVAMVSEPTTRADDKVVSIGQSPPFRLVASLREHLTLDGKLVATPSAIRDILDDETAGSVEGRYPETPVAVKQLAPVTREAIEEEQLRKMWAGGLTPEQKQLLEYLRAKESLALNYRTISLNFELEPLVGAAVKDHAIGRRLHYKKVKASLDPLFSEPYSLLQRDGERGPIRLGRRGHRLLDIARRDGRNQLSD